MDQKETMEIELDGETKNCEILFTYHSEQFNKDYCFFVVEGEEEGVTVMSYVPSEEESGTLTAVETDEEWAELEEVLLAWQEDGEEDECGCSSGCSCGCDCCCD